MVEFKSKLFSFSLGKNSNLGMPKANKKNFAMASLNRLTNDWVSTAASVNFDLSQGLSIMRNRGRYLVQNDPLAKKFVSLLRKNVIGPTGFTLKVKAYEWVKKENGMQQVFDKFANRLIQDKFWYWMKKKHCHITENMSFREEEELVMSTVAIEGECFIVHLQGKGFGGKYNYTTQLVDSAMVDERYNKILSEHEKNDIALRGGEPGDFIYMGIEFNKYRKPTAYYFRKIKPQEEIYLNGYMLTSEYDRIPAENVCHLFVKEFINQARGICWFAPAALRMHMLNKASEAAMVNFRVGASKTLVLEQQENMDPAIEEAESVEANKSDPYGNILEDVEPGETYKVPYGYKPHNYDPQYPNGEFGTFTDSIMQQIASGFDVSHPSLSGNYSGTTWTSSRTALIDERDGWKRLQNWFIEHFLDDVYANWLKMFLLSELSGQLPAGKFDKFNEPFWLPRKWEWVDPEKEENARIKQFKYKFKTFGEIIGADNKDLEEHLEALQEEKEMFDKYGIEFPEEIPFDAITSEDEKEVEKENAKPKKTNGKVLIS